MNHRSARPSSHTRRGAILIAALWVLIALVGLVLVMSRWARVEATGSGNRLAAIEAAMAARAGEQYVLSQVEQAVADSSFLASATPPAAVPAGTAYFWVIRPDRENDQQRDYGVDDEGAKLNINTASRDMLLKLPGMTVEIADAIIDWRDEDQTSSENGAESSYYQSLPQPYRCKDGPFESVEELLLVKGMTPQLLYGLDANRNGILDAEELAAGGDATSLNMNSGNDTSRGILPFVSVTGPGDAAQATQGTQGAQGGAQGAQGGTQATQQVNVNGQVAPVIEALGAALAADRLTKVTPLVISGRPFRNLLDFYLKTQLTPAEFAQVADRLTATTTGPNGQTTSQPNSARVNVNTAPLEVLRCLPGIEDADAQALVGARQNNADLTSLAWVATAITNKEKAVAIGDWITTKSYRYSADVVGVSGDGRAFHRVRLVVDGSKSPPAVVYRRDMTDVGWPLDPLVRQDLRSGAGVTGGTGVSVNAVSR